MRAIKIMFMAALALAGIAVRLAAVTSPLMWYGDHMVFALMAKHIAAGMEFPIYMWACQYAGTLASYIGAVLFRALGASYLIYNTVGLLFSCLWALFSFLIARRLFEKGPGRYISMLLILVPPFWVLFFSLFAAMHAEIMMSGSLLALVIIIWVQADAKRRRGLYPVLGFLSGAGLWIAPSLMPLVLTGVTVFLINDRKGFFGKGIVFFAGGFLAGYLPALVYNMQYPGASLFRMAGRLLDLDRSALSSPDLYRIIMEKAVWRISTIPASAIRVPRLLSSLTGALNTVLFFTGFIWVVRREYIKTIRDRVIGPFGVLALYAVWFFVFYSALVGEDSPRYVLPLYIAAPFFIGALAADMGKRHRMLPAILFISIAIFDLSDLRCSFLESKAPDYPRLAERLAENGIGYAYSDYDTAYCVTFASGEKTFISPTIFDDRAFSERYPAYTKRVREAASAAYIIQNAKFPEYAPMIHRRLKELGVAFKKDIVDGFTVYYGLSRKVYPEELKLPVPSRR